LGKTRKGIKADDRLALGDDVNIGENEDLVHGAACQGAYAAQHGRNDCGAKGLSVLGIAVILGPVPRIS
jgi:hypothetical protein